MPPTSVAVLDAVRSSHTVASRCWLLIDKAPITPIGRILPGGTVTLDTTQDNMRTCSFQLAEDPNLPMPSWMGGLAPTGAEILLQQGISINGTTTWWPLGVFRLGETDMTDSDTAPGPVWQIDATDRSIQVSANLFTKTYTTDGGSQAHVNIYNILRQQAPWITRFNLTPTGVVPFRQVFQSGDDPWQACVEIAQSAGMVIFFSANGTVKLIELPNGRNTPTTLSVQPGNRCSATSIVGSVSNQPGYNGLQVTSTNAAGVTISITVWDNNPSSPLYYKGPYGKVPAPPVALSNAVSYPQLVKIAQALLPSVLGLTRTTTISSVGYPFVDAYDLVWINAPKSGVRDLQMLTGFTTPLDALGLASLTTIPLGSPPSQYVSAVADLTQDTAPTFGG